MKKRDILFRDDWKFAQAKTAVQNKGGDINDPEQVFEEYKKISGAYLIHEEPKKVKKVQKVSKKKGKVSKMVKAFRKKKRGRPKKKKK